MTLEHRGTTVHVPGGNAGRKALAAIHVAVPERNEGRQNWHREQDSVIRFVKHLLDARPNLFPATLTKADAPDFVLAPEGEARPFAIEHTDFGSHEHQRALDAEAEAEPGTIAFVGGPDGWAGDVPEEDWASDLEKAVRRKAFEKTWRNAPDEAERWLLLYDNTETSIAVSLNRHDLPSIVAGVLKEVGGQGAPDGLAVLHGSCVLITQRPGPSR